ncbi:MAG: hypothetical protein ACLPVI_04190 [Dehalococcoidales bacterium]
MENNRKSIDAGIIDIIVGLMITAIGILGPFALLTGNNSRLQSGAGDIFMIIICGAILLSLGLFTVYGGEMAMKRRRWGLALAASICASLIVFGIPSLILTILSKKEFAGKTVARKYSMPASSRYKR